MAIAIAATLEPALYDIKNPDPHVMPHRASPFEARLQGQEVGARLSILSAPARARRSDRSSAQRQDAILRAAGDNFGRFGYRGASLRDIARDAGVSLTLLNHHFGDKSRLLHAVIDAQRPKLEAGMSTLRALVAGGTGSVQPGEVVHAWARMIFGIAVAHEGEIVLRVIARVIDEPPETDVDAARAVIDRCILTFIDALRQCYAHASIQAVGSVAACATATLLRCLASPPATLRLADAAAAEHDPTDELVRLTDVLVAAVDAALGEFAAR